MRRFQGRQANYRCRDASKTDIPTPRGAISLKATAGPGRGCQHFVRRNSRKAETSSTCSYQHILAPNGCSHAPTCCALHGAGRPPLRRCDPHHHRSGSRQTVNEAAPLPVDKAKTLEFVLSTVALDRGIFVLGITFAPSQQSLSVTQGCVSRSTAAAGLSPVFLRSRRTDVLSSPPLAAVR